MFVDGGKVFRFHRGRETLIIKNPCSQGKIIFAPICSFNYSEDNYLSYSLVL